jgi:hypothetical protein
VSPPPTPSPDKGNRSSFRNVVFSDVFQNTGRWTKSKTPVIPSVIHHRQNPLECCSFVSKRPLQEVQKPKLKIEASFVCPRISYPKILLWPKLDFVLAKHSKRRHEYLVLVHIGPI